MPPVSSRAMFEPLGVPFVKLGDGPAFIHLQKAEEKLNEVGNTHRRPEATGNRGNCLGCEAGSHLCELLKVALWCFLEPDTCEGENSLLSTCGELRAPSRALNLKPFKPSIGQRAFLEHLLSMKKMHF